MIHGVAGSGIRGDRKEQEARNLLKELTAVARKQYVSPYAFALVYAGMKNKDQAFAWLDRAYEERAGALPFVKINPTLASLDADPRFHNLLRRLEVLSRKPLSIAVGTRRTKWKDQLVVRAYRRSETNCAKLI